jgi:tetratricopeptide (TPR) repeat protein
LGFAGLIAIVACKGGDAAVEPAALREPSLRAADYAFAGCAVVRSGPRCELSEARELTFWVPTDAPLVAASDAGALAFASTERAGSGTRYRLRVPVAARFVELRERGAARGFRLPVGDAQPSPALAEASALRAQGKFAEARARVESAMSGLSPELQGRARALLARIALSEDDTARAAAGLRESMEAAARAGRISDVAYDGTALSYVLIASLHDHIAARSTLDRVAQVAGADPASAAFLPHYRALLALDTGDVRGALALFREAAERTGRLGLREHELLARQKEATTLVLLGRHDEAIATQQRLLAHFTFKDACQSADAQERLAWFVIQAEPTPRSELAAIGQSAAQAAARHLEGCASRRRRRNHVINAGLFALQQGDTEALRAALAELDALRGGDDALLATWAFELRGRAALAAGQPNDALAAFRRALALSQRSGFWDNEHLAQVGIGRSFEALRKPRDAIAAYAAAEALMDRFLSSVPLGEGQAGFLHERESGTRRLIALLVDVGQPAQALDVARRARARVIAELAHPTRLEQLDAAARARWESAVVRYRTQRAALEREQAEAWKLPADRLAQSQATWIEARRAALAALEEANALLRDGDASRAEAPALARPGPREVLLSYFPIDGGVLGFAARAGATVARRLPPVDLDAPRAALGAAFLEPFGAMLNGVERIFVVTHAELARVDVHALELSGAPLLARAPVVYALDAPAHAPSARASSGALVMVDPLSDLPAARGEGEIARRALSAAPADVFAQAQATRARALSGLARAGVFHYAGHGQFAGTEGIDSGLRLADGQLSLGDILALPAAPQLVVLSACEGARAEGPGFAGGLGVAEAFIAAGVREVVAATRPVADVTSAALVRAFYAARSRDPEAGATAALREAELQMRKEQPDADWASFRVLVP